MHRLERAFYSIGVVVAAMGIDFHLKKIVNAHVLVIDEEKWSIMSNNVLLINFLID